MPINVGGVLLRRNLSHLLRELLPLLAVGHSTTRTPS